jgi:uncharacterized protein DUF5681
MSDDPVKSRKRLGPTSWRPGQSGNPKGRPTGSRNRASLIAERLLSGETEVLIDKLITLAKSGDVGALKICVDKLLPPARERPCLFRLPKLQTTADACAALAKKILLREGATMTREKFKARLAVLEEHRMLRQPPSETMHLCFVNHDRCEIDANVARGPNGFLCRRNADEELESFKSRADDECLAQRPKVPVAGIVFMREAPDAA